VSDDLEFRLDGLLERLRTAYDGIGHSSGRPYVYFVYPPKQERRLRRLVQDNLRSDATLCFHHIDLVPLTIRALAGEEERRQALLEGPQAGEAADGIVRLWARALVRALHKSLEHPDSAGRPVVVLVGLAALHPLGNPTLLMERLAEQEPRDPVTNKVLPVVLFVPGLRPPQTSRRYLFLGREETDLVFYRGEEF
jgi:hypothetical protein